MKNCLQVKNFCAQVALLSSKYSLFLISFCFLTFILYINMFFRILTDSFSVEFSFFNEQMFFRVSSCPD